MFLNIIEFCLFFNIHEHIENIPFFEFSPKETPHETKMSLVSFISTVALISKEDL